MIEPKRDATSAFGFPSMRPSTHGITCTGTSWRCSARCTTASPMRAPCPSRGPPPLEIRIGDRAPQLGERRALLRVGDDDEVPVLRVARRRRLLREARGTPRAPPARPDASGRAACGRRASSRAARRESARAARADHRRVRVAQRVMVTGTPGPMRATSQRIVVVVEADATVGDGACRERRRRSSSPCSAIWPGPPSNSCNTSERRSARARTGRRRRSPATGSTPRRRTRRAASVSRACPRPP